MLLGPGFEKEHSYSFLFKEKELLLRVKLLSFAGLLKKLRSTVKEFFLEELVFKSRGTSFGLFAYKRTLYRIQNFF